MKKMLKIEPIYGWGWFDKISSIEVPEVFEIEVHSNNEDEFTGIVITPNHLLTGFNFQAWSRHRPNSGDYNCELTIPPDKKVNGYCIIGLEA